MKQLLKNAKIYDGTGSAPFPGDVLIENDRSAAAGDLYGGDDDAPAERRHPINH